LEVAMSKNYVVRDLRQELEENLELRRAQGKFSPSVRQSANRLERQGWFFEALGCLWSMLRVLLLGAMMLGVVAAIMVIALLLK
jgi:hypothetical protein